MVKRSLFPAMCLLPHLLDEEKGYQEIRRWRWRYGTRCPHCTSNKVVQRGHDHRHPGCQRHHGKKCGKRFDDLTGTIFANRHQPLPVWIADVYLMGLNLSNRQISKELGLNESDGPAMAEPWRGGIVKRRPKVRMVGVVECDEVYVVAGHQGRPDRIKSAIVATPKIEREPSK